MIDPTTQTKTDRDVREQFIREGLLIPLGPRALQGYVRVHMARIQANTARLKEEFAANDRPVDLKERRYGRAG